MNFYDFEAESLNGQKRAMAEFKDKVVVVVNTASKCGLTTQFEGLEELNKKYKDEGLVIIGFPCNQFAKQEPGEAGEIQEFCQLNYGVSFPMFSKIDVNGENAHPLYKYLKSKKGGWFGSSIKWNFTKFVIDKNGNPVKRFAPTTKPADMEALIKKLLRDGDQI
jgi:glutathione peroxidase